MRIAIVGAHSATKRSAPYEDPQWQIWSLSPKNAEGELPCVDVWFELHKRFLADPDADGKEYGGWLRSRPVIYMLEETPHIPQAQALPRERLVSEFGRWFFNSSLAWILGHAIQHSPEHIGIWGVESSAGEYAAQRPSILFFAQVARMRGIKVDAPGSRVLDPEMLYGFDHLV